MPYSADYVAQQDRMDRQIMASRGFSEGVSEGLPFGPDLPRTTYFLAQAENVS